MPHSLADLVETYGFSWDEMDRQLAALAPVNVYRRFFAVIGDNRDKPAWWVESRAGDEAGDIEKRSRPRPVGARDGGYRGAIDGPARNHHRHDAAFKVIGGSGLVAPTQVTSGVAQALISTALGLLIALFALFGFNFFARMQSQSARPSGAAGVEVD